MVAKKDRAFGVMFGLAVGDALGLPFEFMDKYEILEKYGNVKDMIGGGTWGKEKGTVSDDTCMALAVAEGICRDCDNPVPQVGRKFLEWYDTKPFDVGTCIAYTLRNAQRGIDWYDSAREYNDTTGQGAGNGALMRTAYVGAYYWHLHEIEKRAKDICKMTHWHKKAQRDCALMSLIIHDLISGKGKNGIEERISTYEDACVDYDLGVIEGEYFYFAPNGYTVNSMMCALRCVLKTDSFRDAVLMAVSMGGDTDTIGAITGAIAGALYGYTGIPSEWIDSLDKGIRERLYNVSKCLEVEHNEDGFI